DHVAPLGVVERAQQSVDGALDPFFARHAWTRLPAQRPAEARAERRRQIDRRALAGDLVRPLVRLGMGEVRREAQHRRDLPGAAHRAERVLDAALAVKEAVVVVRAFAAEPGGGLNPLVVVHPAADEIVEIALGEDADLHGSRTDLITRPSCIAANASRQPSSGERSPTMESGRVRRRSSRWSTRSQIGKLWLNDPCRRTFFWTSGLRLIGIMSGD